MSVIGSGREMLRYQIDFSGGLAGGIGREFMDLFEVGSKSLFKIRKVFPGKELDHELATGL